MGHPVYQTDIYYRHLSYRKYCHSFAKLNTLMSSHVMQTSQVQALINDNLSSDELQVKQEVYFPVELIRNIKLC